MKQLQLAIFISVALNVKKKKTYCRRFCRHFHQSWMSYDPNLVAVVPLRPPAAAVGAPDHDAAGGAAVAGGQRASTLRIPQLRGAAGERPPEKGGGERADASRPVTMCKMFRLKLKGRKNKSVSKEHTNKYLSSRTTASRGSFNVSKKAKNNMEQQCVCSSDSPGKLFFFFFSVGFSEKIPKNIQCVVSNLE